MSLPGPCDLCGSTLCGCVEAECRACNGEGGKRVGQNPIPMIGQRGSQWITCEDCHGTGWIKCDRGGAECRFAHCYCEAAWERQQEANASEPPMTADERHRQAWEQKQVAKGRIP